MEFYNRENNLVTVSNSILKHYGCKTFHETCKSLDKVLDKTNKKICVLLLDGFGKIIQEHHKDYCEYVLSHKKIDITSVFPPTTAAATTSLLTGKYPMETGWLGWNQKFPMWDDIVTMFRSSFASFEGMMTPILVNDIIKNKTIDEMIKENNPSLNVCNFKSLDLQDRSVEAFFNKTNELVKENDFLYSYLTDPDHTLHQFGECSKEVNDVISRIDKGVKMLVENNPDTLFLTLADHGHILVDYLDITDYPLFLDTLKYKYYSIESRAAVFYVEDGKHEKFLELAKKYFGEHFEIYNHEEIKKLKIFGEGTPYKDFEYFIGDFILISKDNICLNQPASVKLTSQHAGGTDIEKYIAIGIYNE